MRRADIPKGEGDVLVWSEGAAGRIHLNRPQAMNALNNVMVRIILRAMSDFEARDDISAVVVTAQDARSFCAGGDLKELYNLALQDREMAVRIWSEEYILNARIATYPKPWLCLVDGLCMGAGMAMAVHGRMVVLSETAQLSMPEVRIGFYPDVGVTFHLSRLPARLGFYYGLSGRPIAPGRAVEMGLAQAVVPQRLHGELIAAIANEADPLMLIQRLALPTPVTMPDELSTFCEEVFSAPTWDECSERLAARHCDIGMDLSEMLLRFSPAALHIAFKALTNAQELPTVPHCLRRDMMMNAMILQRHDFYEGVRSLFFVRGTEPVWKDDPATAWPPQFNRIFHENLRGICFSE